MPRGKPGPRSDYIRYEITARRAHEVPRASETTIRKQSTKRWAALPRADRDDFGVRFNQLRTARAEAARLRAEANFKALPIARLQADEDWEDFVRASEQAARAFQDVHGAQQAVVDASEQFVLAVNTCYAGVVVVQTQAINEQTEDNNQLNDDATNFNHHVRGANLPPIPQPDPPRNDGALKIKEAWISERYSQRRKDEQRRAIGNRTDVVPAAVPAHGWRGGWMMPDGGQGITSVWVRRTDQDRIRDRLVQKDVFLNRNQWGSANFFWGNLHDPVLRQPFENNCHQLMDAIRSPDGTRLVPGLRQPPQAYNQFMRYRLTMDWCAHGDLHGLIDAHSKAGLELPEPLVWRTFFALALAGFAMEHGDTLRLLRRLDYEIVHRDLKPGNVFLDNNPTAGHHFQTYPIPLLADFGLAIRTKDNDLNPDLYIPDYGTDGFFPPEQLCYVDAKNGDPCDRVILSTKTNVYGVGLIMYCMVCLDTDPRQPQFLADGKQDLLDVHEDAEGNYSGELLDLIQRCLQFDPLSRPSFEDILNRIDQEIDENGHNRAQNTRTGPRLAPGDPFNLQFLPPNRFQDHVLIANLGPTG